MRTKKAPQRHITHAGFSIPATAKELDMPEGLIRKAVGRGEIEVIPFGGLRRVPPREIERLRQIFGKSASTDTSPNAA